MSEYPTPHNTARHSTQKPQNSQNRTGFVCGFHEFCVDRRGQPASPGCRDLGPGCYTTPMRLLALLILALQPVATMSEIMVNTIYPASDAVFYISTRMPSNDTEWKALETKTVALAEAAAAMTTPMYFRDRDRWMADAQLLIEASNAAVAAARRRDAGALVELNDALYTSCVQCHQHYRLNYGRRAASSAPAAQTPNLEGIWSFATLTPFERPAEFAQKAELTGEEATAYERRLMDQNNRDRRNTSAEADLGGAYNEFWWDRGTHLATVGGKTLTALIADPKD